MTDNDKQRIAGLERRLAQAESRIAELEAELHRGRFQAPPAQPQWVPSLPLEVTCSPAPHMTVCGQPFAAVPMVPSQTSFFTVR